VSQRKITLGGRDGEKVKNHCFKLCSTHFSRGVINFVMGASLPLVTGLNKTAMKYSKTIPRTAVLNGSKIFVILIQFIIFLALHNPVQS